jgi:uncharacterized membrane protein (UPF0127 family)
MALIGLAPLICCASRLETRNLTVDGPAGTPVVINVELARTAEQHIKGLMKRKSLDDGKGMLFIFDRDDILSFWMKDTLIPLSIAFISADGRILEIYDMEARNLTTVRSSRSARFALEVPQGWFDRAGIGVGDRIRELNGGNLSEE